MNTEVVNKINRLKAEKNGIILAHYYQPEEVQRIADYTGDSLGLSRKAAETDADLIVFCGVDFMAESAAILSPNKQVLLPARDAGCPMSEMVTVDDLREMKDRYPQATVVSYVNSSAAVKAESDLCCTSSNAVDIINAIDNDQIIFVPDQNLANYVSQHTTKRIIPWEGYCITHHRVRSESIKQVRALHPDAEILVHPECRPEVVKAADFVGSTAQILNYAQATATKKLIIGTEMGILYQLQENNPHKEFYLLDQGLICQNMKKTSLNDIVVSLEEMRHEITVPQDIRVKDANALDRMLSLSK